MRQTLLCVFARCRKVVRQHSRSVGVDGSVARSFWMTSGDELKELRDAIDATFFPAPMRGRSVGLFCAR